MRALTGRVDEIDMQVEKIKRLIDAGSRLDPELAAGYATSEDMPAIQRRIDQAAAACEAVEHDIKTRQRLRAA
jgi:hypothetical protein